LYSYGIPFFIVDYTLLFDKFQPPLSHSPFAIRHYICFMSKIIVPTDFTSVSEVAIRYANELASLTKSQIHLLHIVDKENERAGAEAQMKDQANKLGIGSVGTVTAVGNIFEDIPDTAERENAELIVMGTHGLRGMQFIVGSNALRVVSEGNVARLASRDKTKAQNRSRCCREIRCGSSFGIA